VQRGSPVDTDAAAPKKQLLGCYDYLFIK